MRIAATYYNETWWRDYAQCLFAANDDTKHNVLLSSILPLIEYQAEVYQPKFNHLYKQLKAEYSTNTPWILDFGWYEKCMERFLGIRVVFGRLTLTGDVMLSIEGVSLGVMTFVQDVRIDTDMGELSNLINEFFSTLDNFAVDT